VIGGLLVLGFGLSFDNFRTSVALGLLRLGWRRAARVALIFGVWDGLAPVVGILVGGYLSQAIGSIASYVGAVALAAYGVYLILQARRTEVPDEVDERWLVFGLPLPLSLDNVVAGTSLGLAGYSPWIAPPLFGAITALVSFVGLQFGHGISRFVRIRADLLTGITLVVAAVLLWLNLADLGVGDSG
jgi:manganese efflux pump family protein